MKRRPLPVLVNTVLAPLAAVLACGGIVGPAAKANAAAAGPATKADQSVPPNTSLWAVSATSPANAWAVGSRSDGKELKAFIEHWDGKGWRQVKAPSPAGPSELFGVSARSAGDAWAVGISSAGPLSHTLIEHWNGRSWRRVPTPGPACSPGDFLSGVSAVSAASAWAVGTATSCVSAGNVSLILHWNGRKWKLVDSPNPGEFAGTELAAVTATSGHNAWAVGSFSDGTASQTLTLHWNGRKWKQVPSPDPLGPGNSAFLTGVAATRTGGNAWAVGTVVRSFPHSGVTMVLHWNGHSWKRVPSPHPGKFNGDELNGISLVSPADIWAVGDYRDPNTAQDRNLIMRWNGRHWNLVLNATPAPPAHDSGLSGVAATSGKNAWAAGGYASGSFTRTLIDHWDGLKWRRQQ